MADQLASSRRQKRTSMKMTKIGKYFYRSTEILGQGYTSTVYRGFGNIENPKLVNESCAEQG